MGVGRRGERMLKSGLMGINVGNASILVTKKFKNSSMEMVEFDEEERGV